jgi:hypothetical protein
LSIALSIPNRHIFTYYQAAENITVKHKLPSCLGKHHAFLNSALNRCELPASRLGHFNSRRKSPRYPLDGTMGGPRSSDEISGEENNLSLPGTETKFPGCPARGRVAILTELPRFKKIITTVKLVKHRDNFTFYDSELYPTSPLSVL